MLANVSAEQSKSICHWLFAGAKIDNFTYLDRDIKCFLLNNVKGRQKESIEFSCVCEMMGMVPKAFQKGIKYCECKIFSREFMTVCLLLLEPSLIAVSS